MATKYLPKVDEQNLETKIKKQSNRREYGQQHFY